MNWTARALKNSGTNALVLEHLGTKGPTFRSSQFRAASLPQLCQPHGGGLPRLTSLATQRDLRGLYEGATTSVRRANEQNQVPPGLQRARHRPHVLRVE